MFVLLVLKLWATGASMVAGQSTHGSEAAARVESIAEQAALTSPPADRGAALGRASPSAPAVARLPWNDDLELASPCDPDDTGPPPSRGLPEIRIRAARFKPRRCARRLRSPPLTLRI